MVPLCPSPKRIRGALYFEERVAVKVTVSGLFPNVSDEERGCTDEIVVAHAYPRGHPFASNPKEMSPETQLGVAGGIAQLLLFD